MMLLEQGVNRIKSTVQQLLNIGRKEPLETRTGDIDQLLRDCLELTCMGHKNIRLDFDLKVGRPVTTGLEALRQIVLNLGGNSVQALGRKSGSIRVFSRLEDNLLTIKLADSGPGIPEEHLDKIFEPFFTTKDVGEGTGLGLSVSHSLARQLGGELSVENIPFSGACFTLTIPLDDPATETAQ